MQYLVKWKGYPDLENQWVNWDDLHAEEALADFKKKNPDKASHIKAGVEEMEDNIANTSMSNDDHSSPHRSLLSQELTCHLRSDSSFSTGDLQWPLAGPHLLSPTVKVPPFPQGVPPSEETTINPRLLSLPICHSMQCTPHTPPTTPSLTTPTTPQRTPSLPHTRSL